MITNRTRQIAVLFLVSCAGAAWAQQRDEPPVPVKTDGLPLHVARHVEEKAAQGITALRQYVWISRSVNQLDLRTLVKEEEPERVARTTGPDDEALTVAALNAQR
jgi:hypothetical protein